MRQLSIGQKAPLLCVSRWAQGEATNLDRLIGKVILVEVFQVNCPGCFLYSLPQAIDLYRQYGDQELRVLGVASAFEDFDKNTLQNLMRLVEKGEVIGETLPMLELHGQLAKGKLPYHIPFPVAMDQLHKPPTQMTQKGITDFIDRHFPAFDQQNADQRQRIQRHVEHYLLSPRFRAATFELFQLKGTPSHIVVDKKGRLRACEFGHFGGLEALIRQLLLE